MTGSIPPGLPRSCRYCSEMVCGDVNYCEALHVTVRDSALARVRRCDRWSGNDIAADTYEIWTPRPEPNLACLDGQMAITVDMPEREASRCRA